MKDWMPGDRVYWFLIGGMVGASIVAHWLDAQREDRDACKANDDLYRQWCLVSAELRKARGEPVSDAPYIVLGGES